MVTRLRTELVVVLLTFAPLVAAAQEPAGGGLWASAGIGLSSQDRVAAGTSRAEF